MPTRPTLKKPKAVPTRSRRTNGHVASTPELKDAILVMARDGTLAEPARLAIQRLKQKGLPVVFQRGNRIIRQYPNGREKIVGTVQSVKIEIPRGVKIIEET